MPGEMRTIDAGLPRFTGTESTEDKVSAIQNYLYLLLEELQYVLHNLGKENLNPGSLEEIETEITDDIRVRLEGENGALTRLAADVSGIRAQVTDADGSYTVLNLKSDGLHVGSASGTTTIAGSSIEAGSLRLSDNLSFNAVGSTASGAASAAANADALARALASGTPVAAAVGTFINGRNIYSPNIYTNLLTLQPPQATAQWSGGLDLRGYYGSRLFDMFRMSYYQGDGPYVNLESPDGAGLTLDFPSITILRGDVFSYGDIRADALITGAFGTAAPSGAAGDGQLYFQIVG